MADFVRGDKKEVKDLREKFLEVLEDELGSIGYDVEISQVALERIADRMIDAVALTTALDPE